MWGTPEKEAPTGALTLLFSQAYLRSRVKLSLSLTSLNVEKLIPLRIKAAMKWLITVHIIRLIFCISGFWP